MLETTVQDPGQGMTRRAVADGAGLVLSAGGDGTLMAVARALAHSSCHWTKDQSAGCCQPRSGLAKAPAGVSNGTGGWSSV